MKTQKLKITVFLICSTLIGYACSGDTASSLTDQCFDADGDGANVLASESVAFSFSQVDLNSQAAQTVKPFSCDFDVSKMDCDDTNANINPSVSEDAEGLVDLNCNGTVNGAVSVDPPVSDPEDCESKVALDTDTDGTPDDCDSDDDGDKISDKNDNCTLVANEDQVDVDEDKKGDVCDDGDEDGILDSVDNCLIVVNADQVDGDEDLIGDACDDSDDDGVMDDTDNCVAVANSSQTDTDQDGLGDECDSHLADKDRDGVTDIDDNCPDAPNADQADADGNGFGDICDGQDTDGDGTIDTADNCPQNLNPLQYDKDGDGVGNVCDADYFRTKQEQLKSEKEQQKQDQILFPKVFR